MDSADTNTIIVTARKRAEALKDVPVAITAISGDTIEKSGFTSVKDVATLTPSLDINSDGAGRAFIAIRGIGTTLVDTVQPGVGIFVDGIYQPNTSYLNNPMVDVARVEVLRGPQGSLYGKNTLGGAINVITRDPGNDLEVKLLGSYAGPDHDWSAGASISGALVPDKVLARIAYSHQQDDGFMTNTLLGKPAMPLNSDTVNGTLLFKPASDVRLTINGYYTRLIGGAVPYTFVTGPTDYNYNVALNATNYQYFKYYGVNAKLEAPIALLATKMTLIGSYDERDVNTPDADPDFTPVNLLRSHGTDTLRTRTAELRFDSTLSSTVSSILGLFYSRETRGTVNDVAFLPDTLNLPVNSFSQVDGNNYSVFGNLFWRPDRSWELSAGLRWDRQSRVENGYNGTLAGPPVPVSGFLREDNLSPRIALTYHWNDALMTYASVARGARGGGFNPPGVPASLQTYKGDTVWTFELGSKLATADHKLSLSGDVFYNDYSNYIGLNSIYAVPPSFVTVDLNTGHVSSYGVELEGAWQVVPIWTLSGGVSLMHARITNDSEYIDTVGRTLASNRLPFQPDWNLNANSDVTVPVGDHDSLSFDAGVVGKGSRIAATLSENNAPVLTAYVLTNASITWRHNGLELSAFATNLFDKNYMESYIEKTTLILAGLPASDVGIPGDRRRVGVRARLKF
ncbi:MAG: TonB-dependent receptor [Sphingomonadales bacterium]|nr:TonB-dependent receptor [Sphingomonadales bacterium]